MTDTIAKPTTPHLFDREFNRLGQWMTPSEFHIVFGYDNEANKAISEVLEVAEYDRYNDKARIDAYQIVQNILKETWLFEDWMTKREIVTQRQRIDSLRIQAQLLNLTAFFDNRRTEVLAAYY